MKCRRSWELPGFLPMPGQNGRLHRGGGHAGGDGLGYGIQIRPHLKMRGATRPWSQANTCRAGGCRGGAGEA